MGVLTLSDVKNALNLTTTTNDAELQLVMNRAEAAITRKCGPLLPTTINQRCTSINGSLILTTTPVISVSTVTDARTGVAVDITKLDSTYGVVTYLNGGSLAGAVYDVVYIAGRSTLPQDLYDATIEMVRHLWGTQRGGAKRPGATGSDSSATMPGYFLPNRVAGAIEPYLQTGP